MISIEKLLEAKELNLNTNPFWIENNQIILKVTDEEKEETFCIPLAEFKVDFKDNTKVYSWNDLSTHEWNDALEKTCQKQIDRHFDKIKRKERLTEELLLSLR
jgi:hypothetical protein